MYVNTKNCPSDEVLRTLATGGAHELNGIDHEAILSHLRQCPKCWERTRVFATPPRQYRGLDLAA